MRNRGWITLMVFTVVGTVGCIPLEDRTVVAAPPGQPVSAVAGPRCSGNQPVKMHTRSLSPYVYQQGDGYAYFDVWIQACPAQGRTQRQPLDIALVLDTSGSMGGQKIQKARAAADYLLRVLNANDRLSLVTYNTHVAIQFPLTAVTHANRQWMASRIHNIYASGMTNLAGGLDIGVRQLTQVSERNAVSRVILISDGLANVGITAPSSLNGMAAAARRRRASVTTMGVGLQFNELLLQSMAEYGGGRYHYISRARDLVAIFRQEVQGAQAIVATSLNLQVTGCAGCRIESVPGYAIHRRAGSAIVAVRDLAGGETMKALVKVRLPHATPGNREIGLSLSYNASRLKNRSFQQRGRVRFNVTADRAKVHRTIDSRVAGRVARVHANQLANRAMKAYQFGNTIVAGQLLRRAATTLRSHARRYKKRTFSFEADSLSAAAVRVRAAPSASRRGQHLQKSIRYGAGKAMRK